MTGDRRTLAMIRRGAGALCLAALACGGADAAPGDRQYVTLVNHDQSGFLKALRAGTEFVRSGRGRQFRIVLASAGVLVAIPGTSAAQLEYMKTRRGGGLQIIACKETMDALSKANKRRIPVLPGISVQTCKSLRDRMNVSGWQLAPGL